MTAEPFAKKCSVPRDALAYRALRRVDYADAYSIKIEARGPEVLDLYARVMFGNPPRWISALMGLRDHVVSVFGLKTSAELRAGGDGVDRDSRRQTPGLSGRIGPFAVLTRLENELLLGADDRHLDFRISIQCTGIDGGSELRVVTVVKFNNLLGRIYFLPVKPIHRIIVPAMMGRAAHAI
jgi:Protein of unknown function (DUF2867)